MANTMSGHSDQPHDLSWALQSATLALKEFILWAAKVSVEDGSDLRHLSLHSSKSGRPPTIEPFKADVANHIRGIIENGYFDDVSGKRVFVPRYIRSQLLSETGVHL